MSDDRRNIDLDRWLRTHVRVLNDMGQRGFDQGVRTFNCPLCRDTKGRGWVHVAYWTTGCFNVGCDAHERLQGGALELVRLLEQFKTRGETFGFLKEEFGVARPVEYKPIARSTGDFIRWPEGTRWFKKPSDPMQRTYELFVQKQWGISLDDAIAWGLGYSATGFYAQRVIIPIVMFGQPVAFQARALVKEPKKPKYITSRYGPEGDEKAECGRPASAILFNYDRLREGGDALIVEGPGDVMGWTRGNLTRQPTALAMLGVSLTPEKLAMLAAKKLKSILLAADAEPEAQEQAEEIYHTMLAWDLPVKLATWDGGKDAGSGARPVERKALTRTERIRARLSRSR